MNKSDHLQGPYYRLVILYGDGQRAEDGEYVDLLSCGGICKGFVKFYDEWQIIFRNESRKRNINSNDLLFFQRILNVFFFTEKY